MELIGVTGGVTCLNFGYYDREKEQKKEQMKQLKQEMRKREGLADIRRRAGEDALRAAMRVQHGKWKSERLSVPRWGCNTVQKQL